MTLRLGTAQPDNIVEIFFYLNNKAGGVSCGDSSFENDKTGIKNKAESISNDIFSAFFSSLKTQY